MRLGVLDKRMIIDVLVAVFDVEAVEGRVYGLAREQGVHVVAAQLAPERYRSRAEAGGALLTHVGGGDVKGGIALALDAVVVDRGVLTDAYFADGIGQVGGSARAGVALDDCRCGVGAGDYEHARMADGIGAAGGQKEQVQWLRQCGLGGR